MSTYTEQLAEINTAITRVLSAGQSLGNEGSQVRLPSLEILLSERKRLEPLAAGEAAGIITTPGEPVIRYGIIQRSSA